MTQIDFKPPIFPYIYMKLKLYKIYMKKMGKIAEEVCKTNLYHNCFGTIVMYITIPCFWRWFAIFQTHIDFAPPIFLYIYIELKLYKIYMNKTGKNAEEVCNTNLYHSSFGTIVVSITIPCFWQ